MLPVRKHLSLLRIAQRGTDKVFEVQWDDGTIEIVDFKFLKEHFPMLLIDWYEATVLIESAGQ
jgi:hypothetical protein